MIKVFTNKIQCKHCGDIIESAYTHDFKWCSCGMVAVDGGRSYLRRCFHGKSPEEDYIELSDYEEMESDNALDLNESCCEECDDV